MSIQNERGDWSSVKTGISNVGKKAHRKIDFRLATKASNAFPSGFDAKQIAPSATNRKTMMVSKDDGVSGPVPGMFDPAIVTNYMQWKTISRAGPGAPFKLRPKSFHRRSTDHFSS
jgi:hypothetical protein